MRNLLMRNCALPRISLAAAATLAVSVPAMAAVPTLSGAYVYTSIESCYNNSWSVAHTTGTATFTPSTGTATISGYHAGGTPPTLTPVSGTISYSNTATTITLNGTTYEVSYGKATKGVATHLAFIAVVPGDSGAACSDQGTLTQ